MNTKERNVSSEPMVIKEPNVRWPIYLFTAIITALLMLLMAGAVHLSRIVRQPTLESELKGLIRPGAAEFEQFREKVVVEELVMTAPPRPSNGIVVELNATVKNATGKTVTGLEVRGAVLDAQRSPVLERTILVVPARQTVLEPGESINVRIPLEGLSPTVARAGLLMEVSGVRFD